MKTRVIIGGALVSVAVGALLVSRLGGHLAPSPRKDFRHGDGDGGDEWRLVERRGEVLPDGVVDDAAVALPDTQALPETVSPAGGYGVDVRVNNPALDKPEMTTQSEPSLAVHGSTVCAGYNNTRKGGIPNPVAGVARSADLGSTWLDEGIAARYRYSDPVLAVHKASGRFYYGSLSFFNAAPAIGVAVSTDDCRTFPTAANASLSAVLADLQDKPWITVDNSGSAYDGNVYACWTRFVNGFTGDATRDEIRFSRSTDGGATFTDEQVLSPPTDDFPFGCNLEVGPHGEVYLAWSDRSDRAHYPLRFRRSFDGGLTWDPPVQVNHLPIRHPGIDRVVTCEANMTRTTLNGDIRTLVEARMAVDLTGGPFNGAIYMVWGSDPPGAVDNSDIFINRSTDGGVTWSPDVQLAGGTVTDQFFPAVAVGGAGTVVVAWYDRRNDPVNNFLIDVYSTVSRDGGVNFAPLRRITDESFPVPPINGQAGFLGNFDSGRSACYMGDYIALTADETYAYYAWGDNRNTLVTENYPDGRPDPDVYFERLLLSCGDGVPDANEQCDDGNLDSGDGCDANCTLTACGNSIITAGEECDDGNLIDGDGCQADCTLAPAYTPTPTVMPTATPTATPVCNGDCNGDGTVNIDELITAVNIALDNPASAACSNADMNHDGRVTVDEIIAAVDAALNGCQARAMAAYTAS